MEDTYKKWRYFDGYEPSRSTLWRRKKRKRLLENHRSNENSPKTESPSIKPDVRFEDDSLEIQSNQISKLNRRLLSTECSEGTDDQNCEEYSSSNTNPFGKYLQVSKPRIVNKVNARQLLDTVTICDHIERDTATCVYQLK